MTIVEYFDPKNVDHIIAYKELQDTGIWPRWFWKWVERDQVTFSSTWQMQLSSKLADEYIKEKLDIE